MAGVQVFKLQVFQIRYCTIQLPIFMKQMESPENACYSMDSRYLSGMFDNVADTAVGTPGDHEQAVFSDVGQGGVFRYQIRDAPLGSIFPSNLAARFEIIVCWDLS